MTDTTPHALAALAVATDYQFRQECLLLEAITHPSFLNESPSAGGDYQRLEFLGDAVLSFHISRLLWHRFPQAQEGELSRLRSRLVDEDALAEQAIAIGLGDCLRLGRGEERGNGRKKKSILSDAFEALLGAIYLDGGTDAVGAVIGRLFNALLERIDEQGGRDNKSALQEALQGVGFPPPQYRLVATAGPDHDRTYTVEACVNDRPFGVGTGRSKKDAEQEAARLAMQRFRAEQGEQNG
ncbi:MAG TPA: ribonuclease III [Geobacterales bacterium]|nr:ribonuclease III [Geobacterales bacterium]